MNKLDKAKAMAQCGKYPRTWESIIKQMHVTGILAKLSARDIATVADLMSNPFKEGMISIPTDHEILMD